MNPEISAIICTHNRAGLLDKCIRSLYDQTLEQGRYEVIIVDNGSVDETESLCTGYSGIPGFRYIKEPVLGLSQARNTGWKAARSSYVGYLDDDATASPQWLEQALYTFLHTDPQPEWVGGAIFLDWEMVPPSWLGKEYEIALGKVDWGDSPRFLSNKGERLGGGNSFYTRDFLNNIGGFDVRLGRISKRLLSAEETQLQIKLQALGGRLFYNPEISIRHFVPKDRLRPMWFYRRYYWGGRSDVIMEKSVSMIKHEKIVVYKSQESQLKRFSGNFFKSLGLCYSKNERIQGRIYMAYVLGWFQGMIRSYFCRDMGPQ